MTQTAENKSITSRPQQLLRWLLAVVCLTGVPAALVFFAAFRFYTVAEDEIKFRLKTQLQRAANEATVNVDQEGFWCRLFYSQFNDFEKEQTTPAEIIAWLNDQQELFPGEFEFIAWTPDGKEQAKTFHDEYSVDEWFEVFKTLRNFYIMGSSERYGKLNGDIKVARKVLGPQLISAMLSQQNDPERFKLCWLDSSFRRPPVTRYFLSQLAVLMRYNPAKLEEKNGLRYSLKKLAQSNLTTLGLARLEKQKADIIWRSDDVGNMVLPAETLTRCEKESLNFLELPQAYLGYLFLTPKLRIFALTQKNHSEFAILQRSLIAAFAYLFLMLPFLIYTWNTIVAGRPGRATIKVRLAFLFFFACGIPLLAMIIISHEHYSQKRRTLMSDAHQSLIDMILSFDRRFLSFLNNDAIALDKVFANWTPRIKNQDFNINSAQALEKALSPFKISKYYIAASESKKVICEGDLFVLKGDFDAASIDYKNSQVHRKVSSFLESDIIASNLIAKKIMSDLNRVEISAQTLSKLELVAESLLQQTMLEMTNTVISNLGRINNWGFGRLNDMSFVKIVSANDPNFVDYAAMLFWRPISVQTRFLKKVSTLTNRNFLGLRLITRNRLNDEYLPEIDKRETELRKFASRLSNKPTEEIEMINLNGEEYIAVGFNGRNIDLFQLIALYPMRNIERTIGLQKTELLLFALFSMVLAASLAQILAKSFIEPLHALRNGALAIENREFTHRITGVGKDEFGEVATIFNGIMVGFEELEVARIVQESLFPQPRLEHGHFATFGKSVSMSELGGDYFDFFVVDDQHFAVLAGEVAGQGVGAALIMAMAKAGVLSSSSLLATPAELLQELHKMILASKSKNQKKVMTFQYLYLNSETGKASYANASGCSPILIRRTKMSAEEISLESSALGAFTEAEYHETTVELKIGDAIVFYTDGIIKACSPDGNEIGSDGLKQLLLSNYNSDPEIFYENIFAAYASHVGSNEIQDDLTLIITMYKPLDLTSDQAEKKEV